jgi:hypothetical protein
MIRYPGNGAAYGAATHLTPVMAGPEPAIYPADRPCEDDRVKPGHDGLVVAMTQEHSRP